MYKRTWITFNAMLIVLFMVKLAYAFTVTGNMGLKIPSTGDTDYPTSISDSFTLLDTHDHSAGKGVQIPTGGIATGAITGVKLNANVVDNSTLEINANALRIKNGGVTKAKLTPVTVAYSADCGTLAGGDYEASIPGGAVATDISNCTVSVTGVTAGRAVVVGLIDRGDSTHSGYYTIVSGASQEFTLAFQRGTTTFSNMHLGANPSTFERLNFWVVDPTPAAGTNVYKVVVTLNASVGNFINFRNARLVAYEL